MKQQFKEPILASIYSAAGYIVILIGALIAIGVVIIGFVAPGDMPGGSFIMGFLYALLVLVITGLIALPLIGIAQLINYIGKTAFFAESIDDSITISTHEISKSLGEISRSLHTLSMKDALREFSTSSPDNISEVIPPRKYQIPPPAADTVLPNCDCPECGKTILLSHLKIADNGITKCPYCDSYFKVENN